MDILPLVDFISSNPNFAAQVKALVEQNHGLQLRSFVGLFLSYQYFDLKSQETLD